MPLTIAGFRHSSPHSSRPDGSRIHVDKKTTEMLLNQLIIVSVCRVEERRDGGRSEGIAVAGGFRPHAGASISTMATFPLPALRTRRAVFPQRALQWDHAARTRVDSSSVGMAQRLPPPAPREWHLSLFSPTAADPGGKPVLASPPSPAVPRFRAVPRSFPFAFACGGSSAPELKPGF